MSGVIALEQTVLNTPGIEGIVLRYGRLYGPGTWFDKPAGPGAADVRRRRARRAAGGHARRAGHLQHRRGRRRVLDRPGAPRARLRSGISDAGLRRLSRPCARPPRSFFVVAERLDQAVQHFGCGLEHRFHLRLVDFLDVLPQLLISPQRRCIFCVWWIGLLSSLTMGRLLIAPGAPVNRLRGFWAASSGT